MADNETLEKFEDIKTKIKFRIDEINYQGFERYLLNERSKMLLYDVERTVQNPITDAPNMRRKYKDNFKYLKDYGSLLEGFTIKSAVFNNSLLNKKDIKLSLVQLGDNFNIVYIDPDNKYYFLLDDFDAVEITQDQYDKTFNLFRDPQNGLKKYFDKSLTDLINDGNSYENTQYITIKFKDHFEHFGGRYPDYIMFLPALSTTTGAYLHRMTLLMAFSDDLLEILYPSISDYYDTFCLNPPSTC